VLPAWLRRAKLNALLASTTTNHAGNLPEEPAMNPTPANSETSVQPLIDPAGADHDLPFTWGRPPTTYLTYRQVVRLTILRSKLESVRSERLATLRTEV
jgi:hypothetical protein